MARQEESQKRSQEEGAVRRSAFEKWRGDPCPSLARWLPRLGPLGKEEMGIMESEGVPR